FVETDTAWLPLGLDVDLLEAMRRAARSALVFLQTRVGLDRPDALSYLSAAADFSVGQLVNGVHTVYCRIRRADFTEPPAPRTRAAEARCAGRGLRRDRGRGGAGSPARGRRRGGRSPPRRAPQPRRAGRNRSRSRPPRLSHPPPMPNSLCRCEPSPVAGEV